MKVLELLRAWRMRRAERRKEAINIYVDKLYTLSIIDDNELAIMCGGHIAVVVENDRPLSQLLSDVKALKLRECKKIEKEAAL